MSQILVDRRDVEFVLYEQLHVEELFKTERYKNFSRKTADLIIHEARNLAVNELLPINAQGDKEGCRFEGGDVTVPECYRRPFHLFREGGWITATDDPEVGGQGMPVNIAQAVGEHFSGANMGFCMYTMVCHGAGKLIEQFCTPELRNLFMKKVYAGEWAGTMALTEPQAGTDVGALTTSAREKPDGTYSITGQKIFISGAEQNLTENIIYPVLARIEGSPSGTAGISLFLVPKIWVNPDGSLGEPNDVVCTGIEEKMGLHGSATCQMTFGAKGKCRGFLMGEKNKGMAAMFQMMNEIRLNAGSGSTGVSSAAYLYALNYARERIQGKHLTQVMDPNAPPVPLIQHPDVRRNLLWMKAITEGMRSFNYYVGNLFDQIQVTDDKARQKALRSRIALLTPIAKAYCSDRAFDVCSQAMQVFGGYGYCKDYPVEQLLRDTKIACIAEGANGIQAMDLLGRKVAMDQGRALMDLVGDIKPHIEKAAAIEELKEMAAHVDAAVDRLLETAAGMGKQMMAGKMMEIFAHAYPFLEAMGDTLMAWMHLWRASVALEQWKRTVPDPAGRGASIETSRDAAHYDGALKSAEFFIFNVLPLGVARMGIIGRMSSAAVDIHDRSFGA